MRFQLLAAQLALAALVLAAAAAAVAVAGVRLGLFAYKAGLALMVPATALGLIALLCALTWMFRALARNQGEGKRTGLIALIGALLFLWTPLHTVYTGLTTAPINDVTSAPENPPLFVALAKARRPGMNSPVFDADSQITFRGEKGPKGYMLHEFYPTVTKPHSALLVTTAKWFWRNFETVKHMGWDIVAHDEKSGLIEARASSFWFGQISDIAIRIEPAGPLGARLDMRVQSESGTQDFGHNMTLVKDYFHKLSS